MKPLSIESNFIVASDPKSVAQTFHKRIHNVADLVPKLCDVKFNEAYDLLRHLALSMVDKDGVKNAIETFKSLDEALVGNSNPADLDPAKRDIHAAIMQILTSLYIESDNPEEALVTAAALLNRLAQEPKRKDEPFLTILGALLHDIAYVHNSRGEYKQAERELEKSMKLFERLAKNNPERYGAAHIMGVNASTQVYRSRVKQANMLAHNQVATSTYLEMMNSGIEGATDRLIDSLSTEGRTLAQMGRYREAVQYFSRALKYLTKIEPEFTERQLKLSIDLGEALLNVNVSRDKGIHLLNTMLHKATKLNADTEHRRIVDILLNAKSRRLDILGIWHKVFPR